MTVTADTIVLVSARLSGEADQRHRSGVHSALGNSAEVSARKKHTEKDSKESPGQSGAVRCSAPNSVITEPGEIWEAEVVEDKDLPQKELVYGSRMEAATEFRRLIGGTLSQLAEVSTLELFWTKEVTVGSNGIEYKDTEASE
ncbi:hypothetical protein NDU88_005381 [Pleurodeles waltl]|uniref:Uncharacterized protein n=1 Tax=Pleurodeles waltl TaxID=8319 RepID=A0AAV7SLR1_PLEWA|nr:hypothetical protein NDU88_005381 [Pleurodeles waltl]